MPGFSVDAGSSEWQVVYEFCRYYGGIAPRFDRLGRLVLAPWEEGRRLVLGADAAVTSFRLREQRYGVLSEVLVRDRTTEEVQRVADEDFLRRGGRCRRVLTMPGKSSYQAMRYSGAYQLARAREELRQAELELPASGNTRKRKRNIFRFRCFSYPHPNPLSYILFLLFDLLIFLLSELTEPYQSHPNH